MMAFVKKKKSKIPKKLEVQLLNASVSFIVKDLRPFRSLEGEGFNELANTLTEIRAKHGAVNANNIMPSRFTVKREVTKKEKCNISKCLIKSIDAHGMIGITTDMWTDIKNRHFMSITCHYFGDGKLKSATTHVAKFDEKKTGDNLLKQIQECADEIGLSTSVLSHCCFVTDDASYLRLALSAYHHITCACHVLSTVLHHVLQPSTSAHSDCPLDVADLPLIEVILKAISQCKSVTAYFKRTGLNNKLTNTLKQSCDT